MLDIYTLLLSPLAAGATWLIASPRVGEPVYRGALFEPHRFPKGDWSMDWLKGTPYRDLYFETEQGKRLHGWLMLRPGAAVTIIVNHGNTGNISDLHTLINLLLQANANLFVYDYRGYGKSEGLPSVAAVCEDAVYAYDFIAREMPDTKIVLYGESLGGGISSYVAQRRKVSALVLQSAFFELRQIAIETFPFFALWPRNLFPRPYLHSGEALPKVVCPVLILHGTQDQEVKVKHAKALFAAAREPKRLVMLPNTAHEEIDHKDWNLFSASINELVTSLSNHVLTAAPPASAPSAGPQS